MKPHVAPACQPSSSLDGPTHSSLSNCALSAPYQQELAFTCTTFTEYRQTKLLSPILRTLLGTPATRFQSLAATDIFSATGAEQPDNPLKYFVEQVVHLIQSEAKLTLEALSRLDYI